MLDLGVLPPLTRDYFVVATQTRPAKCLDEARPPPESPVDRLQTNKGTFGHCISPSKVVSPGTARPALEAKGSTLVTAAFCPSGPDADHRSPEGVPDPCLRCVPTALGVNKNPPPLHDPPVRKEGSHLKA